MRLTFALLSTCLVMAPAFQMLSTTQRGTATALQDTATEELELQKSKLLQLIGPKSYEDPVLMDPLTKEALQISETKSVRFGDRRMGGNAKITVRSASNVFDVTPSYTDLLQASTPSIARQLLPLIPVALRSRLSSGNGDEIIPMRDLFTSPAVSFAYERGWRQNFIAAGFPGPDKEAELAMEFFGNKDDSTVLVDMSCATGLFTRRFAQTNKYNRVLGCDYSDSMLNEARRRINAQPDLDDNLELIRLDVGNIPMQNNTIDYLHAGAAMHCWPELDRAASEIYRVLKPNGGKYFATTFLAEYFRILQRSDGAQASSGPSKQAFQYFSSTQSLKDLMVRGGFDADKVSVEVLGSACVVIRAEK